MVHRAGRRQNTVRIEGQTNDLLAMAFKRVAHLASDTIPNFCRLVEAARHDQITEGVVERHRVNDVFVLLKTQQFAATLGVPDLACPIVAARDKFVSRLVECAIRQRQQVRPQHRKQLELLLPILHLLLDEAYNMSDAVVLTFDQLLQLRFARLVNERLLQQYLVDQSVHIGSSKN